uniref:Uncharacterized protein n=1 Tax=Anguilla anguilla TaxID=7936 RepID=A0A0E9XCG9_ANGAN
MLLGNDAFVSEQSIHMLTIRSYSGKSLFFQEVNEAGEPFFALD